MQIQFKQAEIIEALKGYIVKQGINLRGKTIEISFTAGRGDTGLSASIVIEDILGIPTLEADADTASTGGTAPALSIVKSDVPTETVAQVPPVVESDAPAAPAADAAAEAKAPVTSLFG